MISRRSLGLLLGIAVLAVAVAVLFQEPDPPPGAGPLQPEDAPAPAARSLAAPRPAPAETGPAPAVEPAAPTRLSPRDKVSALHGRVVAAAGRALPEARVTLFRVADEQPPFRARTDIGHQASADEAGRFILADVPAGVSLGLEARAAGHAPAILETFVVQAGETLDLGDVRLAVGMSIAGTVRDAAGQPLAQARVTVTDDTAARRRSDGPEAPVAVSVTGPEGTYRVPHLASRQYALRASREGFASSECVVSLVLGGMGSDVTQDFLLDPAGPLLAGRVAGPGGEPATEATVRITRRSRRGNTYFLSTTTTDADGAFRFEDVPAGTVHLELFSPRWYLPRGLQVTADSGLQVEARRAAVVRGRLVSARTLPTRFEVTARPESSSGAAVLPGAPSTRRIEGGDPPGRFEFDGLRPGTFVFHVMAPGFAPTTSQQVHLDQELTSAEVEIPLSVGGTIAGAIRPSLGGVVVELRGPNFNPGLAVEAAFPTPPVHGLATRTDEQGRFELQHVPSGTYTLSARPPRSPPIHVRDVSVQEAELTQVGELQVLPGGSVAGRVAGPDGLPRRGARVSADGNGHHQQALTAADGGFRLEGLPPGNYEIRVTSGNLWEALRTEARETVPVRAGETARLTLTLTERVRAPR